uniref:Uncharacterized protein n=1 Tax=Fagus sylvatica TaxID=28930 RepID=A0A2N9HSP6_FAGSY
MNPQVNGITHWFLGGKGEALSANKRVEKRGFADIGAADKGEFRKSIGGAILGGNTALDKVSLRNLSIPGVLTQHNIGTLQDSGTQGSRSIGRDISFRRNKELFDGNWDLGLFRDIEIVGGYGYGYGFGGGREGGEESGCDNG